MSLDNIKAFISHILTDPNFAPTTDDYLKVAWEVYYSSTLRPNDYIKTDPLDHPFEYVYDEEIKCVEQTMKKLVENDLANKELRQSHLYTLLRRKKIINHVFRYIDDKRVTFIKKSYLCCKLSDYIMMTYFNYFDKYLSGDAPELIETAVSAISTLFAEDNEESDFVYFQNLFYLIRAASKGLSSVQLEKEKNDTNGKITIKNKTDLSSFSNQYVERFIKSINAFFLANVKNIKVELLPSTTEKVFRFTKSFRDLKIKNKINNLFYETILRPKQEELAKKVNECSMIDILDGKHPLEKKLINVLSFHRDTSMYIESFFSRFLEEFLKPLQTMALIRDLAEQMINMLNYIKDFESIIYYPKEKISHDSTTYEDFMKSEISKKLIEAKFNPKFGGNQKSDSGYQVVLAFIVDAFLKRGNKFKKTVKPEDVVQLLSYVKERDIFIQHHTNNLFIRLATRSTVGLENEGIFLSKISDLVAGNNMKNATELIESGKEIVYSPDFNYLYIKRQMVPTTTSKYPRFPLPREYGELIATVTNILKAKNPTYQFEWVHYLSTTNIILTVGGKKSYLVASVAQIYVLESLVKFSTINFDNLSSIVGIDSGYLEIIIRSFVNAKMVTIESGEQGKNNIRTGTIKFKNNFFQRKGIITDNWVPKVIKVKNIDFQRTKCAQAAIVRIMKEFRMMKTQQLIERVIEEMSKSFPISVAEIHSCLRELIVDEYIEEQDDSHIAYKE